MNRRSRRTFLRSSAGAAALGWMGSWTGPQPARAAAPAAVALDPSIEPLVRLLEESPRNQVVDVFAQRVRAGLPYRDLLATAMLAAVRNVEPRPSVGFKFHTVLVAQSVHLAAQAAPEQDRWLPIFWALDYFKDAQAQDERERGWTMGPLDQQATLPDDAQNAFREALENWNEPAADLAVAGLVRSTTPAKIWELFFRYGGRDYRSIGHKAIDVANSHRVLGAIGWQHAEPILRSLAYAMLMHEDGNPAQRDDRADRPWRRNREIAPRIPDTWQKNSDSPAATLELLTTLRNGSEDEAADKVLELLAKGAGPQSLWDAVFLGSVELLVRQPAIVALHSVTTSNALHYVYRVTSDDLTRRLTLLQNAAFLPMFRDSMLSRGSVREFALDQLQPLLTDRDQSVSEIFAELEPDPMTAARKTLGYVRAGGDVDAWIEQARRLLLVKGRGAHDYKFACSVFEDVNSLSPVWRGPFLAGAVFSLLGSAKSDNPLIERVRNALAHA